MEAVVKRVVDGDTLILDIYIGVEVVVPQQAADVHGARRTVDVKLGMDLCADPDGQLVMRKVRTRLYKFHAAEMGTPEGVIARDRLAAALPIGTRITVELHGKCKYGRWLIVPILNGSNVCLSLVDTEKPAGSPLVLAVE